MRTVIVVLALAVMGCQAAAVPLSPATAAACPVTTPVAATLPVSFLTPVGRGPVGPTGSWYHSADSKLWVEASSMPAMAGGSHKVLWLKPVGSRLEVTGRRLDGPAEPLLANLPDGYPGDFQSSGMGFPTPGCWEVQARADTSELRFVVTIR